MSLRRKSRWISHRSFAGSNATSWPCEKMEIQIQVNTKDSLNRYHTRGINHSSLYITFTLFSVFFRPPTNQVSISSLWGVKRRDTEIPSQFTEFIDDMIQ